MLLADVTFTSEGMAVVSVLVGTLWGSLIVLWRNDVKQRERHIADLQEQNDRLMHVIISAGLERHLPRDLSPPAPPKTGTGRHRPLPPIDPD